MIIIINGSIGVGKTSVSWALQKKFSKSVMLDGDYIGAVHPFKIYDEERIEYLYETLSHLVKFHYSNGYNNFVINYVFESPASLKKLTKKLETVSGNIFCFWLTCSPLEQKKRIALRDTDQKEWELNRIIELNSILSYADKKGFIGKKIDTDGKSIDEVAAIIFRNTQNS